MKKLSAVFFSLILFLLVFPTLSFAATKTAKVFIFEPSDTNPGGFDPEYQGSVTVTCNGINKNAVYQGGDAPEYHAIYTDAECPSWQTMSATASNSEGETGSGTGTMLETEGYINFNLVPNVTVPEFGILTGILAGGGSLLTYLKLRHKAV